MISINCFVCKYENLLMEFGLEEEVEEGAIGQKEA